MTTFNTQQSIDILVEKKSMTTERATEVAAELEKYYKGDGFYYGQWKYPKSISDTMRMDGIYTWQVKDGLVVVEDESYEF